MYVGKRAPRILYMQQQNMNGKIAISQENCSVVSKTNTQNLVCEGQMGCLVIIDFVTLKNIGAIITNKAQQNPNRVPFAWDVVWSLSTIGTTFTEMDLS